MISQKSIAVRWIWLVAAIVIFAVFYFMPCPAGLSEPGKLAIGLFLAALVAWFSEILPMPVVGLAVMMCLPIFGIAVIADVWTSFITSVLFFQVAAFALSAALMKTKIPAKVAAKCMSLSKGKSKQLVLYLMLGTYIVSAMISDLATTALFCGIASSCILDVQQCDKKTSKLAKCLMIGIPWASLMGGFATPTGSAMNIMAMGLLTANSGIIIPWLSWVVVALPLSLVLCIICWLSLTLVFKPEPVKEEAIEAIEKNFKEAGHFEALDYKVIIITLGLIVAWIASTWTGWDATAIACIGVVILFLPGIDALTWGEFTKSVAWLVVLMTGTINSIVAGLRNTGAAGWLVNASLAKFLTTSLAAVCAVSVLVPLLHMIVPAAPALIGICMATLCPLAESLGMSPAVFCFIVALGSSSTFILGIDNNNMLAYEHGYWTLGEFAKAGIIPTIFQMVLAALWVPLACGFMGL